MAELGTAAAPSARVISPPGAVVVRRLGLVPYQDVWPLQLALLEERDGEEIPDTLLSVEHPAVFTLGRKSPGVRDNPSSLPSVIGGIPVFMVERGGEATYHGPGQVVQYPIFRLNLLRTGPRVFLRLMEEAIVDTLGDIGLAAFWIEGKTGVWVKDSAGLERKIASLGIAVRKSVSYHGLALNVNNDLAPFRLISPCGYAPEVMTNVREILGREVPTPFVAEALAKHLIRRFRAASVGAGGAGASGMGEAR